MTSLREAAQAAMEFLDAEFGWSPGEAPRIDALRAALAEPVQEPVAWMRVIDEAMVIHHCGVADPADDYETAKRKLNSLLCIAQDIGEYFAGPGQRPTAGATYSDVVSNGGMDPR